MKFDKRHFKWFFQRRKRGFDDRETWSLDATIAEFILPRLKRFQDIHPDMPMDLDEKQWHNSIKEMIDAFEIIASDNYYSMNKKQSLVVRKGLNKFKNYYMDLWW
jgi:hypothetical protein